MESNSTSLFTQLHNIVNSPVFAQYGLIGLFLNGLLSSIIPIPTEVTVSALLLAGVSKTTVLVVLAASSIVGGFMSYYIGYCGGGIARRFYKIPKERQENRVNAIIAKYGWIAIFLSPWLPVYADIIPLIAGIKKFDFVKFTITMVSGKIVKVFAIVFFLSWILPLIFK